jgi:hypothetical protein
LNNAKENINKGNDENNQYVLNFMGHQNFDGKKTFTIVEDEEISISTTKKTTMRLHLQKC